MKDAGNVNDDFVLPLNPKPRAAHSGSPNTPTDKAAWTIMVYLGGDNNLAEEMVYALKSMCAVGSTRLHQLYALYDAGLQPVAFKIPTRTRMGELRQKTREFRELNPSRDSDRERHHRPLTENMGIFKLTEHLGRKQGEPIPPRVESVQTTLEKFMRVAIAESPAHSYALILSGHGSGSVTDFLGARKRFDGLSIQDLSATLQNVVDHFKTSKTPDIYTKLNVLGMDSCQMSTGEVASEVARHVDYLIGAEGFEPNTGWPYDLILARLDQESRLANNVEAARLAVAQGTVSEYIKFYASDYAIAELSTDMSALDLRLYESLVKLLAKRGDGLVDLMIQALCQENGRSSTQGSSIILAHWEAQGYKNEQNVDLWDFCNCLAMRLESHTDGASQRLARVCRNVQTAIETLVKSSGYCGPAFQHSHGLSVYFPWCETTDASGGSNIHHYETLQFAKESRWGKFLGVYTETTRRPLRASGNQPVFMSALNREDGLFMGNPSVFADAVKIPVRSLTGPTSKAQKATGQTLRISNFVLLVRQAMLQGKPISDLEVLVHAADISVPEGAMTVVRGETFGEIPKRISAGQLEIKDASLHPADRELFVAPLDSLPLTNARSVILEDTLEITGKLRIAAAVLQMADLEVRNSRLSIEDAHLVVRNGVLKVASGKLIQSKGTFKRGELHLRNGAVLANGDLEFFRGRLVSHSDPETVRAIDPDKSTVRMLDPGKNSVRSIDPDKGTVRAMDPDKGSVRAMDPDKGSVRGGGGSPAKISWMKNPAISWASCELITEAEPSPQKAKRSPNKASKRKAAGK